MCILKRQAKRDVGLTDLYSVKRESLMSSDLCFAIKKGKILAAKLSKLPFSIGKSHFLQVSDFWSPCRWWLPAKTNLWCRHVVLLISKWKFLGLVDVYLINGKPVEQIKLYNSYNDQNHCITPTTFTIMFIKKNFLLFFLKSNFLLFCLKSTRLQGNSFLSEINKITRYRSWYIQAN